MEVISNCPIEILNFKIALERLHTWAIFANSPIKENYRKLHPAPDEEVVACIATELMRRIKNEGLEASWAGRSYE